MKLTPFFIVIAIACYAQNEVDPKLQRAKSFFSQQNCPEALKIYQEVLGSVPDNVAALTGQGACYIETGKYPEARNSLWLASIADAIDPYSLRELSYLELIEKQDLDAAKKWMTKAVRLCGTEQDFSGIVTECDFHISKGRSALFGTLKSFAETEFNRMNRGKDITAVYDLYKEGDRLSKAGNGKAAAEKFSQLSQIMKNLSSPPCELTVQTNFVAARSLSANQEWDAAMKLMEDGYSYYFSSGAQNPIIITQLGLMLCDFYSAYGQTNNLLAVTDRVLPISRTQPFKILTAELLVQVLKARGTDSEVKPLDARREEINVINQLLAIAPSVKDRQSYYEAFAYNSLGIVHILSVETSSRPKAKESLERAMQIAQANNLATMINTVLGNLAPVYFRDREYAKANSIYRDLITKAKADNDHQGAVLDLNNLASMYVYAEKYSDAAAFLEEAVSYVEATRLTVPVENRAAFIREQISAYQFLSICYTKLGLSDKLFTVMEKSRGRMLAENIALGANLSPATIQWVQSKLGPKDAALMYAMAEPSEFSILVITANEVKTIYQQDKDFISRLERKFAQSYGVAMKLRGEQSALVDPFGLQKGDQAGQVVAVLRSMITKAPGVELYEQLGTELRKEFYNLLIAPVEPYLAGKEKIFISPDSYLSFVPFDALQDPQGKYMAEKYIIQYTPSMTILKLLQGRVYPAGRKPMIAFGGAPFAPYTATAMSMNSEQDFRQLQMKVVENAKNHKSQRITMATLGITGGSWKYLAGTTIEVQEIAKKVAGVDVYLGNTFDEGNIKALSAKGELAKYRTIHLATHGMVVPTIPELSTVVTTLLPVEKMGEDGYMTVPEVKDLKLQADFVALSACETGLGKLFAGEGVIGLTQSFLQAGANGMSVSLWPISDDATMRFMIGFYDLVYNHGQPFPVAMAEMKRKFIRGEFGADYKHPNFWAPFAYYGL